MYKKENGIKREVYYLFAAQTREGYESIVTKCLLEVANILLTQSNKKRLNIVKDVTDRN